jgi:hypothetical protein
VRKNDAQIARLTQGKTYRDTKKITFGAAVSWGAGLYSLENINEDYQDPSLDSTGNLMAAVWGAFNFTPRFALQFELNVMNNGLIIDALDLWVYEINGFFDDDGSRYFPTTEEAHIKDWFSYMSLDIPLLFRMNFRPFPVLLLSIAAGAYISLPVSELKNEYHYPSFSQKNSTDTFKITNIQYGVLAGVSAGFSLGPGYITARVRFRSDLVPVIVDEYWGDKDRELFTRRLIAVSLGYELWF